MKTAQQRAAKRTGAQIPIADMARGMLAARQAMQRHLPAELLHDPSVDMLMSLFIAEKDRIAMCAAELATMTTVGPVIAKRWIAALLSLDLIETSGETIVLTPWGRDAVTAALGAVTTAQSAENYVRRPRLRMLFGRDKDLNERWATEAAPRAKIG